MKDNDQELLPLVDADGTVVGKATRGYCHGGSMALHPVVHLHVFNSAGELYLQHRPAWKDIQPDRWDTAVGGHIDWGETVDEALRREVSEEIGLTAFRPRFITRYVHTSDRESELVNVFATTTDQPIRPTAELDGGRFFSRDEILRRLHTDFFTPNFENEWLRIFSDADKQQIS